MVLYIIGDSMNKKGFTLVELLVVMVLIALITLVMSPKISNMFKKVDENKYKNFLNDIYLSTEVYIQQNQDNYKQLKEVNNKIYVYYNDLITSKYLRSSLYDPKKKEFVKNQDYTVEVYLNSNNDYVYRIIESHYYENGHVVYFNPTTGLRCYNYVIANSNTGVKTGCMKWYTFLDNEANSGTNANVRMILDHNTTASVAWNSSGTNISGPNQALNAILADTNSYTGVITPTNYVLNNGVANYTINYSSFKARLITASEVGNIIGIPIFNEATESSLKFFETLTTIAPNPATKKYAWLFDYTNSCTTYGCNISDSSTYGYWTSTAKPEVTASSWMVHSGGKLDRYLVADTNYFGVRPVITVLKSIIK